MTLPPSLIASAPALPQTPRKIWTVGTLSYTTAGLALLFCWLLWGDFAWSMKDRAIPPIMQLLFKKFGASDTLAGLLFGSLSPALGLVLGPIISYRSDRHRGPWGRRIPFLLVSTPIAVLSIIGLAFSPKIGAHFAQWMGPHSWSADATVLLFLALFWMLFDVATVITNAVYAALINDVVPQPIMGRFYGFFRAFGLIAAILFYLGAFGDAETTYLWIFLGVGALYGVGFTIMCLRVKEGTYPPHLPMDAGRKTGGFLQSARTYFQQCFGHRYYWWLFGALTVAGVATGPVNLFSIFFATSVHMDKHLYGKCLALTYCISLVLAYPLGWLADRVHPLRLGIGILILYAAATLWGGFFAKDARMLAIALVAHGVIAGTWATATASLQQRLLPRAEFAQFASAGGILGNLSWIILAPIAGFLLDHLHHDYRYTFFMGSALALAALAACLILHGKFMALGGPRHYAAPEPVGPAQ